MFLNAEKSQFAYPGPCAMLRPAVPNCWTGEFGSWMIRWNALALSHAAGVFGPALGFCPGTRFGRFAENPRDFRRSALHRNVVGVEHGERRAAHHGRDSVHLPVPRIC